jgi:hypothetical protein
MNQKYKSGLKYTAIFITGVIVGALLLESLEIHVRNIYKDLIVTNVKIEQDFLASRAVRESRQFDAMLHRWAAVSLVSKDGFRILRPVTDGIDDNSYLFPFRLFVLKMISSSENVQKGKKIVEGMDRGKLAVAYELVGQTEAAEKQWQTAQQLTQRPSIEETKKLIYSAVEREKSELHRKAEETVLRTRGQ